MPAFTLASYCRMLSFGMPMLEELVDEITVRRMDLDAVEARLLDALGGAAVIGDQVGISSVAAIRGAGVSYGCLPSGVWM